MMSTICGNVYKKIMKSTVLFAVRNQIFTFMDRQYLWTILYIYESCFI